MKIASLHPRERDRLKELAQLRILDTDPECEFDEIAQLASFICDAPIAFISLIDEQRQWFKSTVGLNVKETSRDFAFCAHAILQDQVFEISDATKHELFFDNPLVSGAPYVLHYAGAPISGSSGLPMGTLCVMDTQPGRLSDARKIALMQLSHQVSQLFKLRCAKLLLEQQKFQRDCSWFALQNMADGVMVQDRVGYIVAYNPTALRILDLTEREVVAGRSVFESRFYLHEDGSAFAINEHPAMVALATGVGQYGVVMGFMVSNEDQIHGVNLEVRWVRVSSEPVALEGSSELTHVVTTFTDVTAERQKQAMLVQSAKLRSLGQMAGGIAHEINTPLTIILFTTGLLRGDLRSQDHNVETMEKRIEKIERTTCRIESIVRGLTAFARDTSSDPIEAANLCSVIEEGLGFFRERAKLRGVALEVHCSSDIMVSCVRNGVAQVIVSLVGNSFEAVDELEDRWVKVFVCSDDTRAYITVSDSGLGISESIVDNIMTPFFTTKEVGKGMGLGLSISRSTIEDMGGVLYYRPRNGHTAFHIELPLFHSMKKEVENVA